jgi:hypothetical protein
MEKALVEAKSFEERVYEKIRTDIGSLMTDEELKKLVEKSVDRMFFSDRVIKSDHWGRSETKPPLIFEAVQAAVAQKIDDHVRAYVQERAPEFAKVMEDALAKGFWGLVSQHFNNQLANPMIVLQQQINELLAGKK